MFQHKASQVSSSKLNNLSRKKDITFFNNALYFEWREKYTHKFTIKLMECKYLLVF